METYEYDDNTPFEPNSADVDSRMARFPGPTPVYPGPTPVYPGFVPNVSPNYCPNCNFRPGNNMIYWTWRIFGPGVNMFPQSARVRFSNMSSIREPLDIYLNSRLVLSNLDPRTASGFLQIMPGTYRLTVYRSRVFAAPVINTNITFFRNGTYQLTILGTSNNARIQLTQM